MVIKTARPVAVLAPLNNRRIPKQNSTIVFFIIYNFFDEWKCTFFTVNTNNSVDCVFITTSSKKKLFSKITSSCTISRICILSSLINWNFDVILHSYIHQVAWCANETTKSTRNTGDKSFLIEGYVVCIGTTNILL